MRESSMRETGAATGNPSIQHLVGDALRESSELAQKEFALFRTEVTQNVRTLFIGLAMVVVAGIFAIAALIVLTQALVAWLATVVGSTALAALIVGGVLAVIAIGLGIYGRSSMSSSSLMPQRTVKSVKRDTQVLTERVT
jgi:uncharacterized membrane protein YqjE